MDAERNGIAVTCVCGGWVMLAALGFSADSDKDSFREAGKLAAKGFSVRTPVSLEEIRKLDACEYEGACTTNPDRVRAQQVELLASTGGDDV